MTLKQLWIAFKRGGGVRENFLGSLLRTGVWEVNFFKRRIKNLRG